MVEALQKNGEMLTDVPIPPRSLVDFLWWAETNLRNEKGNKYEFNERAYLKGIYDCTSQKMVIKKSAQVGISSFAISKAFWLCDNQPVTVIFTMPTAGDVSNFSQTRINPSLRNSTLSHQMNVDNVGVKQIGNSFIYMRGAWNEKQALSIPSDFNIHDELDRSKPDVREMYEERLSASDIAWRLDLSTPTIPNYGITALFEETDKREWFVRCKCGEDQILVEENIIDNEYRCRKCKEIIDSRNGYWKATAKHEIAGYHVTQLMAHWIPASEILRKKKDYKFKRDYYNFVLGKEYAGGEGMATRADILACIKNIHDIEGRAVIGVDWGNITWYVIRKSKVLIHMGKIEGDTRYHAAEVGKLMEKFNADCVADFGYGDTKNSELIEKYPGRVWMCIYTVDGKDMEPDFNDLTNMVKVDRTRSIQGSLVEIKNREIEIFANETLEEFIKHHMNVAEVDEIDKHGKARTVIKRAGDDHLLHANNYARLLGEDSEPSIRLI